MTVTTILRHTILLRVYFCLPAFRRSYSLVVIGSVIAFMTMTTPVTTILQYTILLRVYFCLPVFRGGGYCNCNCNCDCYCDRDCHYNSTIYNSIAGILLATRISMATRLCKILYITLSSHIKVKTTPAFPLHIALPIIPISLQILLILLLVYFFLPAQRARGVIVPSQPTLL